MTDHETSVPTLALHAAGGAGLNLARQRKDVDACLTHLRRYDTSWANIQPDEDLVLLADGDGSGKIRSEHAETIQKRIYGLSDEEIGLADVNIVVYSLSGGSGSVIGPLLSADLRRRKGLLINMVVADTASELDTRNTLKTLQTLQAICQRQDIYLPTMVFLNQETRTAVDLSLTTRLRLTAWLLARSAVEVDRNDRRNFLDPMKTVGAGAGVRLMHVATMDSSVNDPEVTGELWTLDHEDIYDSALSIGVIPEEDVLEPIHPSRPPNIRNLYTGTFDTTHVTPILGLIASSDQGITSLIRQMDDTLTRFSVTSRSGSVIPDMEGEADSSGLVL